MMKRFNLFHTKFIKYVVDADITILNKYAEPYYKIVLFFISYYDYCWPFWKKDSLVKDKNPKLM